MQTERALESLEDVRGAVDGELAEMVDSLAMIIRLQKDIRSPMLGSKVTLHIRPKTENYKVPTDDIPEGLSDWQVRYTTDNKEKWEKWSFPWYGDGAEEDPDEVAKISVKVDEDANDIEQYKAIVIEGNVGTSAPDGKLWDPNKKEYRFAEDYPMGTVNCAIAKSQSSTRKERLDFEEDYATDVEVHTSITPAKGEPGVHEYTPGWPED